MKKVDFIVVGQGLSGSVLALRLLKNGASIIVIDQPSLSQCSKVAAGIWNPVVFKRMTKSWMADEVLPEMKNFYLECENEFQCKIVTDRNIIKFFSEQQEIELWKKKAASDLKDYIDEKIYTGNIFTGIKKNEFGFSKVLKAGNLDMNLFLEKTRSFLKNKNAFLEEKFDYRRLEVKQEITYKDLKSSRIIFSEGYLVKDNPFFSYIPFKPAKGEVLTIESQELRIDGDIINKNAFILPVSENHFKCGATYDWSELNDTPTEKARQELQSKFSKISDASYWIRAHEAGVRPAVIDRRPVLGPHPDHNNVFVFNGMGTKGVMLAPYFAKQLVDFIMGKASLHPETHVKRFENFCKLRP